MRKPIGCRTAIKLRERLIIVYFVDEHTPSDEERKKKEALLVMKSLKARFPLSDKFVQAFGKAVRLGVDFSLIKTEADVEGLVLPDNQESVRIVSFCTKCSEPVNKKCVSEA